MRWLLIHTIHHIINMSFRLLSCFYPLLTLPVFCQLVDSGSYFAGFWISPIPLCHYNSVEIVSWKLVNKLYCIHTSIRVTRQQLADHEVNGRRTHKSDHGVVGPIRDLVDRNDDQWLMLNNSKQDWSRTLRREVLLHNEYRDNNSMELNLLHWYVKDHKWQIKVEKRLREGSV